MRMSTDQQILLEELSKMIKNIKHKIIDHKKGHKKLSKKNLMLIVEEI